MDFEEPINPMRAMNNAWDERVQQRPPLRFVGYAWDAILFFLFCYGAFAVLSDPYGLGLGGGWQGVFFTVGGLGVWAVFVGLFLRPVGRGGMLKVLAFLAFIGRLMRALWGGPKAPKP